MLNNNADYDINVGEGQWGENLLVKILQDNGDKIEVKTDYVWQHTGNIYVEYECFYIRAGQDKPSGLSVSKSDYYAFVLPWSNREPIIKIIPTELLKKVVKEKGKERECLNTKNPSKGYIIKLKDIEDFMRRQ
jgi:hypothetical protein